MRVCLLLGTTRTGRQSEKVFLAVQRLLEQASVEVVAVDLAALQLPVFTGEDDQHPGVRVLLDAYKTCDGFVIVTPEYNHGMPGVLKMALDFAQHKELFLKPLAVVSTSSGPYGGVRCVKQLESSWLGLGGVCANLFLPTPHVEAFHADVPPELWLEQAHKFIDKSLTFFQKLTSV
jgi:NAD(P)H-dependent FMN reductase